MAKRYLSNIDRSAGYSFDAKRGVEGSYAYGEAVEHRQVPNEIELAVRAIKESGTTVTTEIKDSTRVPNGDVYFAGGTKVYRRLKEAADGTTTWSAETWDANPSSSEITPNANSVLYWAGLDAVLVAGGRYVGKITSLTGTPAYSESFYGAVKDKEADQTLSYTNSYTLGTTVNEGATHKLTYIPDLDPVDYIDFDVLSYGTGNITCVMHDDANKVIGTKTLTAAQLTTNAGKFYFDEPLRVSPAPNAQTYHFHLYVSAGTTTIRTTTASDLSTCNYAVYSSRLVPTAYQPMMEFLNYVLIGNGNYVSAWEPISNTPSKNEWKKHELTLPRNETVIGITKYDEYAAVATFKPLSSDSGSGFGKNGTEGTIYFWNGIDTTYTYSISIPEGAPESIKSYKNVLYYIANGGLYAYAGGQPVLIRTMPKVDAFSSSNAVYKDDNYLQAPYKGLAISENLLYIGFPYYTVNNNIKHGIYTWGKKDKNFIDSLGYTFRPSGGVLTTQYNASNIPVNGITHVAAYGNNTFVASRFSTDSGTTTSYGVDVIRRRSGYAETGIVENLIYDGKRPWKDKLAIYHKITFEPLPANCSVRPKYSLERGAWVYGTTVNTTGATEALLHINKRFKEIQTGYDLVGTVTGTPKITSDTLFIDDLEQEAI